MIDANTKLCCVIGNPIEQSISPLIHNAAYKALGLNYAFLAFKVTDVKKALEGLKAINVAGISVTIPHKLEVLKYVDEVDQIVQKIGAANTIVNKIGKFIAINTDWIGAIKTLEEITNISNKRVALIGAGGAARAIAYGLAKKDARVYVFNRTPSTALQIVKDFKLEGNFSISKINKIRDMDIIINTTSIGMTPNKDSLIPINFINSNHIVFDIVFHPKETKLIQYAKAKKATVVYGYKMFLYQAQEQFKLFTGRDIKIEIMERAIC